MQADTTPIIAVLPPREGFSAQAFGAVSLSVKDFTEHSKYRNQTLILGQVQAEPYAGLHYEALAVPRRWHERGTHAYARAITKRVSGTPDALLEVHNRPLLAIKLKQMTKARTALHFHNDPQEMAHAKTVAQRTKLVRQLDGVYCVSEWVKRRFLQGLPEGAATKLHVVPCGVNIYEQPTHKHPQILYVGRITPNKGVLEFAEGLVTSLKEHRNWHGILIGGRRHSSSEKLSQYERTISRLTAPYTNIEHRGFQPFEIAQAAFRDAAIAVVPSLWEEPFGRTALEAMSYGCAVISSGRGGQREILGDAGFILKQVNGDSIAEAINILIEGEDKRRALQNAAYQRAQAFSVQACAATLDAARAKILAPQETSRHAA